MSKLNTQQKDYLKTIESKKNRKKLKKAFKKENKVKEFLDSKRFLIKLFKNSNPTKKQ